MFEKFIDKVADNIKRKIEDQIYKFIAAVISYSFNNSHVLTKGYDLYWGNDKRDIIKNTITKAFEENYSRQISQEVSKEVVRQMSIINEEEFIDKIIERIKRKQLD